MRQYFMITPRTGFSAWRREDGELAGLLWGNPQVTRYICASGRFTPEEIVERLEREVLNGERYHVQYWPFFELSSGELIGCCGLRPRPDREGEYELGFHLRPDFWGRGYAKEAAEAVISYACSELHAAGLFAGHNPDNTASGRLLLKLGFTYIGDEFYGPTGRMHPSYELTRREGG